MIFHQVKCELQKKSYWIFMDLNRIKWDSWGIHITTLSGLRRAAVPTCIHCVVLRVFSSSTKKIPKKCWIQAASKSDNEIWQKFPCAGSVAKEVLDGLHYFIWLMFQNLIYLMIKNFCRYILTSWKQISFAAWWYWSLFNAKAQNWLALINNKNAILNVQQQFNILQVMHYGRYSAISNPSNENM